MDSLEVIRECFGIFENLMWICGFSVEKFNLFVLGAQKELSVQIWFCKNPRLKFSQFHIRFCKIHLDFAYLVFNLISWNESGI